MSAFEKGKHTLEATIARSLHSYDPKVPAIRRVADALHDYLLMALLPLSESEVPEAREAANVVYSRFLNGFVLEVSTERKGHKAGPGTAEKPTLRCPEGTTRKAP